MSQPAPDRLGLFDGSTQREPSVETALASIASLTPEDRAAWCQLLAYHPESAAFLDHAWITSWIDAFGPREPVLVCGWEGGRLVGLGALQRLTESWAGRRIAVLQSLTNVESSRFELLASHCRVDVQERLWRALCETGHWDVIRLDHVPDGSPTLTAGRKVAAELGWSYIVELTFESPWRPFPQSPGAWDEGLSRKFKANLHNRERRLRALGEVTFEVVKGGAEQAHALDVFYTLEASGWKGACNTAIAGQQSVKAFYDRFVERASEDVWIPVLAVSGRPAAAQLIRLRDRTLFMLKTAYHPDFAPCSPGQLLTARLIRYGIECGMEALDFLAANMTWKSDWAPRLRPHSRLLLFSPSAAGRYAYWTRYGLRERVKRIPGAKRFVRWLRARRGPA